MDPSNWLIEFLSSPNFPEISGDWGNSAGFCMALKKNSVRIPGKFQGRAGFSGRFGVGGGFGRLGVAKGFCASSHKFQLQIVPICLVWSLFLLCCPLSGSDWSQRLTNENGRNKTAQLWALFRSPEPAQVASKVLQYTSNVYCNTSPICVAVPSWLLSLGS